MNERCTYLLPIRRLRFNEAEAADFAGYFKSLAAVAKF